MPRESNVPVSTYPNTGDGQKFVLASFDTGCAHSEKCITANYRQLLTSGFLVNGNLLLSACIAFAEGACNKTAVLQKGLASPNEYGTLEKLSDDLKHMRKWYTDIEFRVGSHGHPLYAHRALLCARSVHFRNMFGSGMQESNTDIVYLPDMEVSTVDNFLNFLYTSELPTVVLQSIRSLSDMHKLACMYQVASLQDRCAYAIHKIFSPQTVVRALLYNGDHCDAIRKSALQYIAIQRMPIRVRVSRVYVSVLSSLWHSCARLRHYSVGGSAESPCSAPFVSAAAVSKAFPACFIL